MAPDQPAASATRFCHLGINFRPVNYGKNIKNLNRIVLEVQGVFTRFKKGHPRPLFHLFLVFSNKQYKRVFTCRLSIVNFVINHINSIKYSIVWMPGATQICSITGPIFSKNLCFLYQIVLIQYQPLFFAFTKKGSFGIQACQWKKHIRYYLNPLKNCENFFGSLLFTSLPLASPLSRLRKSIFISQENVAVADVTTNVQR